MKYDREEAYLREKLTDGLHPADVDLWPAVAEHLPDARPARHLPRGGGLGGSSAWPRRC